MYNFFIFSFVLYRKQLIEKRKPQEIDHLNNIINNFQFEIVANEIIIFNQTNTSALKYLYRHKVY